MWAPTSPQTHSTSTLLLCHCTTGMLNVALSFLRMIATAKTGGTLTVYSPRFSYSGQKGKFKDIVLTGMKTVKGNAGPPSVDATTKNGAPVAPDAELFDVDYAMQTGPTRYAPMQPIPGTKVTKKDAKPQYPTSSVPIAKSHLPIPTIETTVTQSQTHKVSSVANTVRLSSYLCKVCALAMRRASRRTSDAHLWTSSRC
jgi:hypothetical protein